MPASPTSPTSSPTLQERNARHKAATAAQTSGLNSDFKNICAQTLESNMSSGTEALDYAISVLKKEAEKK